MTASRIDETIQTKALRHFTTHNPVGRKMAEPFIEKAARLMSEHPREFTSEDAAALVLTNVRAALAKQVYDSTARVAYRESLELARRAANG